MIEIKKQITDIIDETIYYDVDVNYLECLKGITDVKILEDIKESFRIIHYFLNGDYQE